MAVSAKQASELWVAWTHDALARYAPPDSEDNDEIVDDMVEIATKYADTMLEEYEKTFGDGEGRSRRRRKSDEDDEP